MTHATKAGFQGNSTGFITGLVVGQLESILNPI